MNAMMLRLNYKLVVTRLLPVLVAAKAVSWQFERTKLDRASDRTPIKLPRNYNIKDEAVADEEDDDEDERLRFDPKTLEAVAAQVRAEEIESRTTRCGTHPEQWISKPNQEPTLYSYLGSFVWGDKITRECPECVANRAVAIANGFGKAVFPNGDSYEGLWKNYKMEGRGVYYYENGDIYRGEFKGNQRHGENSVMTYVNGAVYEGSYANGLKNGQGSITWADSSSYVGEWKDNYMSGNGKYTDSHGSTYEGQFLSDLKHGLGVWTATTRFIKKEGRDRDYFESDILTYSGHYAHDLKNGAGIQVYRNGDLYEGMFFNNKRDQYGIQTFKNGCVYDGEWQQDTMHGNGKMTYENGKVYHDGDWIANKPQFAAEVAQKKGEKVEKK